MDIPTSYLNPAQFSFWLYHLGEKGLGSWISQSVPSTEKKQFDSIDWEIRSIK